MWWRGDVFEKKKPLLEKRMRLIQAIRRYFDTQEFWEVETPALQISPGMEPHVHAFETRLLDQYREDRGRRYLHTSPEFAMKKLLVAGLPKIYQICKTYRNAENSPYHSCEFTMLEWYRAASNSRQIMSDCVTLLRHCARQLKIEHFRRATPSGDHIANPFEDWEIITVCEAFQTYAGIDIEPILGDRDGFVQLAMTIGVVCDPQGDDWDDVFFKVFLEKIEPNLGQGQPTIIYEYPAHMAALARLKPGDPRFAERFELYICGLEIANAFGELTDPVEQRERFEDAMALKARLYGEPWPVDDDFISALEAGMPESGGIALGVDRLAMLVTGAENINDVQWVGEG